MAKGWCSFSDTESLVALCEGNGDLEELRTNLLRTLEAADFDPVDQSSGHIVGLWDARSDISSDELAEAIEAALTRSTRRLSPKLPPFALSFGLGRRAARCQAALHVYKAVYMTYPWISY